MKEVISFGVGVVVALAFSYFTGSAPVGGLVHNVQEDFSAGISVNGTEVIDSSGVVDSTNGISVTCAAASSSVYVDGILTACN